MFLKQWWRRFKQLEFNILDVFMIPTVIILPTQFFGVPLGLLVTISAPVLYITLRILINASDENKE